jgi:hypothetical protein
MNIIDVNFFYLLNQIENNIVHIPSKLPFLTFHQVSYQDLTKYFMWIQQLFCFPFHIPPNCLEKQLSFQKI